MTRRFFLASSDVYEAVRAGLNAAWGLPLNGQTTCFAAAADAPRDNAGKCLLAVPDEFCQYEAVVEMLPGLLASGAVEEIDEATYRDSAVVPV